MITHGTNNRRVIKRWGRLLVLTSFISHFSFLILLNSSCTQDSYEKGEGKYSLMRGDFVEAHVNGEKQVDYITTDEDVVMSVTKPFTTKWMTVADTIYRAILYYNMVEEGNSKPAVEPISVGQVLCSSIRVASNGAVVKTDPVKFESAWLSKNGKYLNLSLYLMTGTSDGEQQKQKAFVVCDTLMTNADSTRTCYLRLYHDQCGVPEYYSSQVYVSIASKQIDADSVRISINTYKGIVSKTFVLSNSNH